MVTLRSWKFLSIATLAVGLSACSVFDPDMGSGQNTPENNKQTIGDEQEALVCRAQLAVKGVKRPSGASKRPCWVKAADRWLRVFWK